jgi:hypothetical protein
MFLSGRLAQIRIAVEKYRKEKRHARASNCHGSLDGATEDVNKT